MRTETRPWRANSPMVNMTAPVEGLTRCEGQGDRVLPGAAASGGVVGEFRGAGDAVEGVGAYLVGGVVVRGDVAALDADGGDDALAGGAVGVDVADPDGGVAEDGGLEDGEG